MIHYTAIHAVEMILRMLTDQSQSLADWLDDAVFGNAISSTLTASEEDISGFARFLDAYRRALPVERAAIGVF